VAIVDLGGGSVQLAYAAPVNTARESPDSLVYIDKSMPSSTLYLNSWLGYGLVAFRMKALETIDAGDPHPCVPEWTPRGTEYKYGTKTIPVIPRNGGSSVEECLELIVKALETDKDDGKCKLITLSSSSQDKQFLGKKGSSSFGQCGLSGSWLGPSEPNSIEEWKLFSYIFDLAQEEGLVAEGESEAKLTASDFLNSAKVHCEKNSAKHDEIDWWKCIDLMYVSALLTHGFRLEPDFPMKVTKRLVYDNRLELEAAWPLGAAIAAVKDEL
jgi:apyrase